MRNYLVIVFSILALFSPAQKSQGILSESEKSNFTIDSLLKKVKPEKYDTLQLSVLKELGRLYFLKSDFKNALKIIEEAIKISLKINNKKGLAACYNTKGAICYSICDFKGAVNNYSLALNIRAEMKDFKNIATIYSNIAMIYIDQGNYAEALKVDSDALKLSLNAKDQYGMCKAFTGIGEIYRCTGKFPMALNNFEKNPCPLGSMLFTGLFPQYV